MAGRSITGTYGALFTLSSAGDNPATILASAQLNAGLYANTAAVWAVINYGTVRSVGTPGVRLADGGSVTNLSGGTINGYQGIAIYGAAGTVVNDGRITGADAFFASGVTLHGGGVVSNQSDGFIGSGGYGVYLYGAGTVVNAGSIGGHSTDGVRLYGGGFITNLSGGTISGQEGIDFFGVGNVVNAGAIVGATSGGGDTGVFLSGGGTLSNQSGGSIFGEDTGVRAYGSDTVINAGSIGAFGGRAVYFRGGYTQRLIVLPGASFGGSVDGGNAGTADVSTLELAMGTSTGTLAGLGSHYINFSQITVDAGADWALTGSNTLATGVVLTDSGTLTIASGATLTASSGSALSGPVSGAATVVNDGRITGADAVFASGVSLHGGGVVSNQSDGFIGSGGYGVYLYGAGTVVNAGSIGGHSTDGVRLYGGGFITNLSGGTISGQEGIDFFGVGNVVNAGAIVGATSGGGDTGVFLSGGGTLSNQSGGSIFGEDTGVRAYGSDTVINAGSIGAFGGRAVYFRGGYTQRLIVLPGASFGGSVDGGNAGTSHISTLELAVGTSTGTLAGLGSHYINFGQITVDAGADWTLTGSNTLAAGATLSNAGTLTLSGATLADAGVLVNQGAILLDPSTLSAAALFGSGRITIGADSTFDAQGTVVSGETIGFGGGNALLQLDSPNGFAGTIDGFAANRTIELTTVAHSPTDSATIVGNNTLHVATSLGTFDLQLNKAQDFTGDSFPLTANGGGTNIELACFAERTRIATARGMVPVELLRHGDRVRTLPDGRLQPIVWLGHRWVDCRHHPSPTKVWPVRISAGAFGYGRPYRDLLLSPDHAVFDNGVLIPIRLLVNGRTIVQQPCDAIAYWHVELPGHAVLSAEGVPAESYLDTGNRSAFANGGPVVELHADFSWRIWASRGCAPLVLDGPRLASAKRRLRARAARLGHRTTHEPGLRVLADGRLLSAERNGRVWRTWLPEATTGVRLVSRVWQPAHMHPGASDTRSLGIAVSRLWLDGRRVALDGPCFRDGWHGQETRWRWTNGDARLAVDGARALAFQLVMGGPYWAEQNDAERDAVGRNSIHLRTPA